MEYIYISDYLGSSWPLSKFFNLQFPTDSFASCLDSISRSCVRLNHNVYGRVLKKYILCTDRQRASMAFKTDCGASTVVIVSPNHCNYKTSLRLKRVTCLSIVDGLLTPSIQDLDHQYIVHLSNFCLNSDTVLQYMRLKAITPFSLLF